MVAGPELVVPAKMFCLANSSSVWMLLSLGRPASRKSLRRLIISWLSVMANPANVSPMDTSA